MKKVDFILTVNIGNKQVSSIVVSANDSRRFKIGSEQKDVDVHLTGDRIGGVHAEFFYQNDQWYIEPKDGEVRVRGEAVALTAIQLSRPISVGPYILRLSLQQSDLSDGAGGSDAGDVSNAKDNISMALDSAVLRWNTVKKKNIRKI